jgi:hypothetical protein
MVSLVIAFELLQVILLAAALPLAGIAAWGYRGAPIGRAIGALPLVALGFLLAATGELLSTLSASPGAIWGLGSIIGVAGLGWFVVNLLHLYSGRRRLGA